MNGKAIVIAALIAAVATIGSALISKSGDPPTPTPVTSITCPQIPPVESLSVTPREGFLFIQEEWNWENGKFELMPGHWERERVEDYGEYIPGHWDTSQGQCVWIGGAFEGQTQNQTIITTDHRTPSTP